MIYFDNSATTKVAPQVLETYKTVSDKIWGNPSSLHALGETADNLLEQSRRQIADLIGCEQHEIFFTSGGTEGDNWVVKGTAFAKQEFGKHIITSSIEHPAVLNSMKQLEKLGFEVTYLPVDEHGRVNAKDVAQAIRPDTILVSIMAINNEIGSIQPLDQIAEILRTYPSVHFHVDAVQGIGKGIGKLLRNDRIDFLTFSGHKFHAPRGIGFMYKKAGRMLEPLMAGGGQEKNQRSGTENLPAIAGMAKALRLLLNNEETNVEKERQIKQKIYDHVVAQAKVTVFSDVDQNSSPHILCFTIDGVRGETIVHAFEEQGIYISTTSACSSKKGTVSGTLSAMHVPEKIATSAVRVSLDENNTLQEAEEFNCAFDQIYARFSKVFTK
ncbi:cysteine desulfurase family protein [Ligilactobacillus acidipiscis]|uniref:cysteine desulfurase family protein n=1 Tax=Ligilactobacillus acidipiscis TaxID=89059 RepID=UPI0023F8D138|nr:cysteine desulfurase family protein [Ligilactobacillus acidipiscis]WEV56013.1 cysteine desulfurase family protein [Ligilactobacillus acidipiscis]